MVMIKLVKTVLISYSSIVLCILYPLRCKSSVCQLFSLPNHLQISLTSLSHSSHCAANSLDALMSGQSTRCARSQLRSLVARRAHLCCTPSLSFSLALPLCYALSRSQRAVEQVLGISIAAPSRVGSVRARVSNETDTSAHRTAIKVRNAERLKPRKKSVKEKEKNKKKQSKEISVCVCVQNQIELFVCKKATNKNIANGLLAKRRKRRRRKNKRTKRGRTNT